MARPLRIEYDGALYHITARGNEGNPIYREEGDHQKFLDILAELPQRYGVIIYGYVLMGNHYHLLIETQKGNITKGIHYLNAIYTGYFNRKYRRAGHLFQGRYKGLLIEKDRYLLSVSRYIHLNPVRAGMSKRPEEYRWSSYLEYIGRGKRNKWLASEGMLGQYCRDEAKARRLYKAFVDEGLSIKENNPFENLKAGLILGSKDFISEIKKQIGFKKHREIPESKRLMRGIKYEDIIAVVGREFRVNEDEIIKAGKRDNLARKICLYLLRNFTDMRNEEIAEYFGIGYTGVSQAASRLKKEIKENQRLRKIVQKIEELLSEE